MVRLKTPSLSPPSESAPATQTSSFRQLELCETGKQQRWHAAQSAGIAEQIKIVLTTLVNDDIGLVDIHDVLHDWLEERLIGLVCHAVFQGGIHRKMPALLCNKHQIRRTVARARATTDSNAAG